MRQGVAIWPLALLLGIVLAGCEQPAPVVGTKTSGGPPAPPPPPESKVGAFAGGVEDLAAPVSAPPAAPSPPATEIVKAEAGVRAKGQSLEGYEGLVVTAVKQLFLGP